jgi:hypothetical protein
MAFVHGRDAVVTLNAVDLSTFTNKVEFSREAEAHDTTAFGKDSKTYAGGLRDAKVSMEGTYDNGAAGPEAIIQPLLGSTVAFIYKPEGAGSGLPIRTVNVVVTSYKESTEVANMIKWTCELQCSDDVTLTTG